MLIKLTSFYELSIGYLSITEVRGTLFFLVGGIIGSFINVLICRLPSMSEADAFAEVLEKFPNLSSQIDVDEKLFETDLYSPSRAPCCETRIKWYHNIPIVSWIILKGRCGYCLAPIQSSYLWIEVFVATIFCVISISFESLTLILLTCTLAAVLTVIALIDIRHKIIPDGLNFIIFVIMICAINEGVLPTTLYSGLAQGIVMISILDLTNKVYVSRLGRPVIGGGDIKLLASVAVGLGLASTFFLFLVALLGSCIFNRFKNHEGEQPIGQWISLGILGYWICLIL